ncbi:hypothetical protein [Streptomyces sp. NPDC095602]|uniref:hypothetical protein n=1 Tax=Streptomyces sp. NPDC095602 TaxID=3155819 RepID=UPI00331CCA1A
MVGTTAVAAVLAAGAAPAAFAAPAPPHQAARAVGFGTTETPRVDAAAAVRLEPAADVLLLSDHDFVHALWQKAREGGEAYDEVNQCKELCLTARWGDDIDLRAHPAWQVVPPLAP